MPSRPDEQLLLRPRRPSPSRRDRGRARRCPTCTLALVTDRGTFSPDRIDPGTKLLLLEAPAAAGRRRHRRPRVRLRADRDHAGAPRARRDACGRSTSTSGPARCARRTPTRAGVGNVQVAAPDDVPADLRRGGDLQQPADPHRQGGAARPARAWLGPARRRARRRTSSCRSTSAPTRSRAGCATTAASSYARVAARGGYRVLAVTAVAAGRREAARLDRDEAPAPRVAPPHRRPRRARSSTVSRRRSTSAAILRTAAALRVDAHLAGRRDAARPTRRCGAPRSAPSATSRGRELEHVRAGGGGRGARRRLRRRRARAGRRRRRAARARRRRRRLPRGRARGPRAVRRVARRLRPRRVTSPSSAGSARSTWPPRRRSRCTNSAAASGSRGP